MSARECFFKKVQQQNTIPPEDRSVEAHIQIFCLRMDELAQQMQQWFEGSGIEVVIGVKSLSDLSTVGRSLNRGASYYDITTIRLQNDIRSVSIAPVQLYQDGCAGCVTLTVDAPDREPGRQQFYLSMAPVEGWLIRNEQQVNNSYSVMTEDIFFQIIENLA